MRRCRNIARTSKRARIEVDSEPEVKDELEALQGLIDRSVRTATPSVADSVAYPERQMSAPEFLAFWQSVRLIAMATVGDGGRPHVAPVHAALNGCMLRLVIYDNTVRRSDPAQPTRSVQHLARRRGDCDRLWSRSRGRRQSASSAARTERRATTGGRDRS